MTVSVVLLPEHPTDCAVCDGEGRVKVSLIRLRLGAIRADWVSHVASCPLRPGADDLRLLLPREDTGGGVE